MIRSPTPDDLRLVRSAWLESYATSDYAKLVTPPPQWEQNEKRGGRVYFTGQRELIERLIVSSVVLVAEGEAAQLDGFVVGWPAAMLHYVYVKQSRRGRGLARALLEALDLRAGQPVVYTHRSRSVRGNPRGWTYDPSPTTVLKEICMDTSKMHRVKYIQLGDFGAVALRGGASSNIELRSFLRTEEDRARAWFDHATGIVYVFEKDRRGEDVIHPISIASCRDVVLYPMGQGPKWEAEERAAAGAKKAATA
jgi:GNAT superfamily N-acetyltransferase